MDGLIGCERRRKETVRDVVVGIGEDEAQLRALDLASRQV